MSVSAGRFAMALGQARASSDGLNPTERTTLLVGFCQQEADIRTPGPGEVHRQSDGRPGHRAARGCAPSLASPTLGLGTGEPQGSVVVDGVHRARAKIHQVVLRPSVRSSGQIIARANAIDLIQRGQKSFFVHAYDGAQAEVLVADNPQVGHILQEVPSCVPPTTAPWSAAGSKAVIASIYYWQALP